MSKTTLTIKKLDAVVPQSVVPFTEEQLIEMLGKIQAEKPLEALPTHLVADKSALPPVDERSIASIQAPPKVHGSFSLNGIPVLMPGIVPPNINPATGLPYSQVMPPQLGGQISPPPSKNFR